MIDLIWKYSTIQKKLYTIRYLFFKDELTGVDINSHMQWVFVHHIKSDRIPSHDTFLYIQ